jgi:hypothetical protein
MNLVGRLKPRLDSEINAQQLLAGVGTTSALRSSVRTRLHIEACKA